MRPSYFFLQSQLCAALVCCVLVGALTPPGSLRCSVPTSSPRRSRFLRSALALLHTHTQTCTLVGWNSQRGDLSALYTLWLQTLKLHYIKRSHIHTHARTPHTHSVQRYTSAQTHKPMCCACHTTMWSGSKSTHQPTSVRKTVGNWKLVHIFTTGHTIDDASVLFVYFFNTLTSVVFLLPLTVASELLDTMS